MTIIYRDGIAGKICSKCGEWKPVEGFTRRLVRGDGYQAQCKVCKAAWDRQRYAADPERFREKIRRYHETHREEDRARARAWREANRERARENERTYRQTHREWDRERSRRWARENPEKKREMNRAFAKARPDLKYKWKRQWREANPDKDRAQYHRRRAREATNGGSFTAAEWAALKAACHYTCLRCGRREPAIKLTPDHIVPVSEGGSNDISNIQPLCGSCNSAKYTKVIDYRPRLFGAGPIVLLGLLLIGAVITVITLRWPG